MTPANLTKLKAAIVANPAWNNQPMTSGGATTIAAALNAASVTNVWRTETPTVDLLDAVDQARYTPNDPVLTANTATDALLRLNARALYAQTKLMVLQNFVLSRQQLDCRPVTVRSSLRDAVTGLPTGVDGAAQQPGGANGGNVLAKCLRLGTVGEIILAADAQGSDTTGGVTARVITHEGLISSEDVQQARELQG